MICNTVQFAFPPGTPRPSWDEIARFLKHLDSDAKDMDTVYKIGANKSLCIKYKSEAAMRDALRRHPDAIKFHFTNGKTVEVRMLTAGKKIHYVRVFDIPPEVTDEELALVIGKFGRIERMVREKFPANLGMDHLYTGVRGVFMEMENDIPPAMDVFKWKAKLYYDGLKEKCFLCQCEGHQRSSCPTKKPVENRKHTSYAGVVQLGEAALPGETDNIENDIIEIVEEEILENSDVLDQVDLSQEAHATEESCSSSFRKHVESMDEEQLREIDEAAEQLGLENFRENVAKLSQMIDELPSKEQAIQRRAQFAKSGSTELRPKKTARKSSK